MNLSADRMMHGRLAAIPAVGLAAVFLGLGGCSEDGAVEGDVFYVVPPEATLYAGVNSLVLEAVGGTPPFRWYVSDEAVGVIAYGTVTPTNNPSGPGTNGPAVFPTGGPVAPVISGASPAVSPATARRVTYIRKGTTGVNVITVEDSRYWTATATITHSEDEAEGELAVSPPSFVMAPELDEETFLASGGDGPYRWRLEDSRLGHFTLSDDTAQCTYRRFEGREGSTALIVTDQDGNQVRVAIEQETVLHVTAEPASIGTDGGMSTLRVTGGTSPYTWTVMDVDRGDLVSEAVGPSVVYQRNSEGDAAVRVTDSSGEYVDTIISQP